MDKKGSWDIIYVNNKPLGARQGCGMALMDDRNILLFGGFNAGFLKDSHCFDMVTHQVREMPPMSTDEKFKSFSFQMPTAYDHSTGTVYTIDLLNKQVLQFGMIDGKYQWNK